MKDACALERDGCVHEGECVGECVRGEKKRTCEGGWKGTRE